MLLLVKVVPCLLCRYFFSSYTHLHTHTHTHTHIHTHSYLQGGELSAETRHFLSPICGLWIIQALHLLLSLLEPVLLLYQDQLSNTQVLVTQSPLAVCGSMDYRPLGSSVHGISQGRILEWWKVVVELREYTGILGPGRRRIQSGARDEAWLLRAFV